MTMDGDKRLSANDRHLWSLCYSTLHRFGCLTMFKVTGPDVRVRLNRDITFFVPAKHERAEEVKAYLEEELRGECHASESFNGEWMWATTVRVLFFSGVHGYMTREECEPMIEGAVESFFEMLEARTRKTS